MPICPDKVAEQHGAVMQVFFQISKISDMTRTVFGLIAAALLMVGCEGSGPENTSEGKTSFSMDCESIKVSSDAVQKTVTVTSGGDWGVTAQDKTWVSVSPSGGGSGTSQVLVDIQENKTGEVRETSLVFRTKDGQKTLPVWQNYKIVEVAVSDAAFKAYLIGAYDEDGDGILSTKEAAVITRIEAAGLGIKDMSGLGEKFPGITYLDCSDNELTELDLSGLTGLTHLDCSGNRLTTIDITLQVNLQSFDASGNDELTTIYVWTGFEEPEGFSKPEGAAYVEPTINTPAGYVLVWQDEFNSSETGLPDTGEWWYETGDGGWGNNELQDYVAGTYKTQKIAQVADGKLTITAQKIDGKVRSVRMNTSKSWTYGYFEARLKLPKGKGTWPAFWMMPKNFTGWPKDGEIDIMEHVGYHQDFVSSSIHCTSYVHSNGTQKTKERYLKGATDEFHVYALEWTPEYIRSYVDGEQLFYYRPEDYGKRNYETWPFDNPFYLKLNLAWGGNWGGKYGEDESCLPATYEIDYVRVFQKP